MRNANGNIKSKVALVRCETYDEKETCLAVERGLALLGGAEAFFKKNEAILLKPNILSGAAPESCVATHPSVFNGTIKILKNLGLNLSYGDSPAIAKSARAAKESGLSDIADRHGVPLSDFENGSTVTYTAAISRGSFPIASGALEADGIVSLCKLKTHGLTRMTGAVKNQYGCIPGLKKAEYHAQLFRARDFSGFLVDITAFLKPRLFIMDAVMAMEGNGPRSGDPKKLGCLLLSNDPVALDAVACGIIDLKPEFVHTCLIGQKAGLGTCDFNRIEIAGDPIEEFIDKTFKVVRRPPVLKNREGAFRSLDSLFMPKPLINHSLCASCAGCVKICPTKPKALHLKNEKKARKPLEYISSNCIRCFCCQEVCPEKAITIKISLPAKLLSYLVKLTLRLTGL